ncbi:MAG: DNA polymerase III subunit chi [Thiomicrospira sp.]|jgi:DNA polymerase-3 subunit chi|nr:DNA polymerase III subunit chi [Thiomicrospira sp.]
MTNPTQDVLFYVLASSDARSRELFLIKLLSKALKQQRRIDVRFAHPQDAQRFDQTLWTTPEHSYFPHAFEHQVDAPIQLFGAQISSPCNDVLINLHPDFFDQFNRYQRTIEVLDQSVELIEKGRLRWRQYKQQGIEPTLHKLG